MMRNANLPLPRVDIGFLDRAAARLRRIVGALGAVRVRWVLRGSGLSLISSNCAGSRISLIAGEPFNSPTVNLWLGPKDFLTFVENLEDYRRLNGDFREVSELSSSYGYPVGALGGGTVPEVLVYFQHFETLGDGAAAWTRRFERVTPDRTALIFTDRDGATLEDLRRFDALPYPKLCFVHRPRPDIRSAVLVPGYAREGQVGDLFSDWPRLASALTFRRLRSLIAV